ncbi:hypothetical protein [Hyphobacterium marinum]|uniref:Uncharacterized protein n=1 Tax=Hyphobacterium marinum TaxID=3116574 RepID=A0ABU7LZM0_9PROT|nr:hypothetical protein [Hyphobacterium sp. Y6023]MEE2567012.1 hypothetical protein [Hyphobacterium sp. Y6023]
MRSALIAAAILFAAPATVHAQASISGSILPSARSTGVGTPATAFAAIANGGDAQADNCRPECFNCGPGAVDAAFSYQTTTPANALSGTPNTPANIPAGETQNYLFSLTPNSVFSGQAAVIDFVCDNGVRGTYRPGLTDFILSSDPNSPDILAIASTISGDGVARITTPNGFIPFAVSAVNIGSGDPPAGDLSSPSAGNNQATIRVYPEAGGLDLPLLYDICEANNLSQCIGPRGTSVSAQIGDQPSYFVVRALGQGAGVPFFPDIVRVNVVFESQDETQRGRTSVAAIVTGPSVGQNDTMPVGIWNMDVSGPAAGFGEIGEGMIVIDGGGGLTAFANVEILGANGSEYGFFGEVGADSGATPPTFTGSVFDINDNNPAVSYDFNGIWGPQTVVRGNLTVPATDGPDLSGPQLANNQTRRIRAVYDQLTDRAVTQAGIAGTYDLVDEDGGTPRDIGDITIDAQGQLSGTVSDQSANICQATGDMTQVQAGKNIFFVNMTLTGACQFASMYSGHAAQMDDPDNGITNGLAMIFGNQNAIVQIALVPDAQFP